MTDFCKRCGQFEDNETSEKLWDVYYRCPDPRHNSEPLVFFPSDEPEYYDEESHDIRNHAMEKDMAHRNLCVECGRPDLSRLDLETYPLMSEEDQKEHYEMIAEQQAERRMGC